MEAYQAWAIIILPSIILGILLAYFIKGRIGMALAGLIPWLSLLAALLYQEYFTPYQGGGEMIETVAFEKTA